MDLKIIYRPVFVRAYTKLESALQDEVKEKITLFRQKKNHGSLRVHKLRGKLKGRYSFSVNYKFRIVFEYMDKNTTALLTIGDHDIYN